MENISKEKMWRIVIGIVFFIMALLVMDLPDQVSNISVLHGWARGAVYWIRALTIVLFLFTLMIALSLWVDTPLKRWGIAFVFVVMLANAPDVWQGSENIKPFQPYADLGGSGENLDYRRLREYPETMNYTPMPIAWYEIGTEHDPHRRGEKTFAEGFEGLSNHFKNETEALARKVMQAPLRKGAEDLLKNAQEKIDSAK